MILLHVTGTPDERHHRELTGVLEQFDNISLTNDPAKAEIIVLSDGETASIRRMEAYHRFPEKCVTISDSDVMDYYVPALYASNYIGFLSKHRALTCSPYTSLFAEQGKRNAWIDRLAREPMHKKLLYSFMGGSTCMLRKRLLHHYKSLDLSDVHVASTDYYKHWSPDAGGKVDKSAQQRLYIETMRASKFALCPRGASPSSIRMFEAMEMGIAPVVMADTWIPVEGVDWSFCLFVKENRLDQLDEIVRSHESEWAQRGTAARFVFEEHFGPKSLGRTLEQQFRQLQKQRSARREQFIHAIYPARQAYHHGKVTARKHLRALVLAGFRIAGRKFPYELNR
ncbi:MAG TPA: exostosin family protein [Variovorax sp.]|nr:exostosin family protein [Variovorax sp.]